MNTYTFLTENYNEGTTIYYAIPEDKIETLNLSDTYSRYGQKVDAYDAGDSFTIDTEEAAIKINNYLEAHEVEDRFKQGDYVSAYDHQSLYSDLLDNIEFAEGEIDFVKQTCDGFNYWDGHNWKTITTACNEGEVSHNVVDDEELIKKLNEAIENREFEKDGFGKKIYKAGEWVIIDDYCQGTWSSFEIVTAEEFENA